MPAIRTQAAHLRAHAVPDTSIIAARSINGTSPVPLSGSNLAVEKAPTGKPPAGKPIKPSPNQVPIKKRIAVKKQVPVQNRLRVFLVHIPKLSIRGQARLASEVRVSRSTVSRLVNGRINPSYRLARGVTDALERFLGRPLDMRDVFSTDGTYLTASGCTLCRCGGCLPEAAWSEDGTLKPEWKEARPGDWSIARPTDVLVPTDSSVHADSTAEAGKEGK